LLTALYRKNNDIFNNKHTPHTETCAHSNTHMYIHVYTSNIYNTSHNKYNATSIYRTVSISRNTRTYTLTHTHTHYPHADQYDSRRRTERGREELAVGKVKEGGWKIFFTSTSIL
jgi:hypothetical protein